MTDQIMVLVRGGGLNYGRALHQSEATVLSNSKVPTFDLYHRLYQTLKSAYMYHSSVCVCVCVCEGRDEIS